MEIPTEYKKQIAEQILILDFIKDNSNMLYKSFAEENNIKFLAHAKDKYNAHKLR